MCSPDIPLRYQMEKARMGRGSRWIRRYSFRGPSAVEFLTMLSWWHSMRVATSGRHAGHVRPGSGRYRRRFGARSWHLRPGHRALACTSAALPHRCQGALDLLVRRGTRSLRSRIAGAHRLRWVYLSLGHVEFVWNRDNARLPRLDYTDWEMWIVIYSLTFFIILVIIILSQ